MRRSRRVIGGPLSALFVGIVGVVVLLATGGNSDPTDAASDAGRCPDTWSDDDVNRQVRLTTTDEWIEFELWSTKPFPTTALFPVVRIGTEDFSLSSYVDDGRLDTLIFYIPRDEFARLKSGDAVWVYYGGAGAPPPMNAVPDPSDAWSYGGFDTGLLDCPERDTFRPPTS